MKLFGGRLLEQCEGSALSGTLIPINCKKHFVATPRDLMLQKENEIQLDRCIF